MSTGGEAQRQSEGGVARGWKTEECTRCHLALNAWGGSVSWEVMALILGNAGSFFFFFLWGGAGFWTSGMMQAG